MIRKEAYAKINLSLDVCAQRPDGMHDVDMVLTSLCLHDVLTFELLRETDDILLHAPAALGERKDNLVYRAAKLVQQTFAIQQGVVITLEKNIPLAAGLGGGSSDAAATLQALIELWQIDDVTEKQLLALATRLGADVPYCLYHETMRARGIGEQLMRVPPMLKTHVVLFKPRTYGIATADAYAALHAQSAYTSGHAELLIAALAEKNYRLLCERLFNNFEQIIFGQHQELERYKKELTQIADAVLLSGSGPTLFAFIRDVAKIQRLLQYGEQENLLTLQTEIK